MFSKAKITTGFIHNKQQEMYIKNLAKYRDFSAARQLMTSCGEYNPVEDEKVFKARSYSEVNDFKPMKKSLKTSNAAIKKIAMGIKSNNLSIASSDEGEQDMALNKYTTDALNYRR